VSRYHGLFFSPGNCAWFGFSKKLNGEKNMLRRVKNRKNQCTRYRAFTQKTLLNSNIQRPARTHKRCRWKQITPPDFPLMRLADGDMKNQKHCLLGFPRRAQP
jgi:hypothetical protein